MPPDLPKLNRRAFAIGGLAATAHRASAQTSAPTGAPRVVLEARPADIRLRPGAAKFTSAWTYNGLCPGPIIRVRQGDDLRVRLVNRLDEETTIHFCGVRNRSEMDGAAGLSQRPVTPGDSFDYQVATRDAGTFLYRSGAHGRIAEQCERGLYGLLIIDERQPPPVDKDLSALIDDWRLDENSAYVELPRELNGSLPRVGNLLTVNGERRVYEENVPVGGRARLRLINAAAARIMTLKFEGSAPTIVAIDGQPSSTAFKPKGSAVIMTPGGRLDLMVDLPGEAGEEFKVLAQLSPEVTVPIMLLRSVGNRRAALPPVRALPQNDLPEKLDLARSQRVELVIEGGPSPVGSQKPWTLNGRGAGGVYSGKPLFTAKRGATLTLSFVNRTSIAHAMHVHGHHGRLLFSLDDGWDPFWVDTVLVQPGRTARFAFVADNPGKWTLGSAMAELFDANLGGW
ncbi:MAG: multicopper oxidase family protein, partial [Beijerinckiaceae bacterium]